MVSLNGCCAWIAGIKVEVPIQCGAAMQKGFHAGPGLPGWGSSAAGRGFGGGLEFTLPSHK